MRFGSTIRALAFGVLVAGVSLGALPRAFAQDMNVRILLIQPFLDGNIPTAVAIEKGFFKQAGLNAKLITAQGNPMTPLLAGEADIAAATGTLPVLNAVAQGQDVRAIATITPRFTQTILVKKGSPLAATAGKWPDSIVALKGKKIGISVLGALVDLSTRFLIMQAGLQPDKDIQVIPLGGGTPQLSGLESGTVDAINSYEPFTSQARNRGTVEAILDFARDKLPDSIDQPYIIAAAKGQYVKDNPEVIKRYRAAMVETFKFMKDPANRDAVVDITAKYMEGLDKPIVAGVVDALIAIGFRIEYTKSDFQKATELMKALGILKTDLAAGNFIVE